MGPLILNAFDLIILSQGLNLATLFDHGQVGVVKDSFSFYLSAILVIMSLVLEFKDYTVLL